MEALEVFLYQILYTREVYPQKIFKKQRVYNAPVYISIYPPLNKYITKTLRAARTLKSTGNLQRVEVVLYRDDFMIYESYVFEIDDSAPQKYQKAYSADLYFVELEEELRKSLLTLSERLRTLPSLPKGTKFKIQYHTTQSAFVKLSNESETQKFPWIQELIPERFSQENIISILPITNVKCTGFQIYVETTYHYLLECLRPCLHQCL